MHGLQLCTQAVNFSTKPTGEPNPKILARKLTIAWTAQYPNPDPESKFIINFLKKTDYPFFKIIRQFYWNQMYTIRGGKIRPTVLLERCRELQQ